MNQDGIRYERSRHVRTIVDRMTRNEIMDHDRMRKAAENGYRIDRMFERACARWGIDPEAAMVAGPLLSLALAEQIGRVAATTPAPHPENRT